VLAPLRGRLRARHRILGRHRVRAHRRGACQRGAGGARDREQAVPRYGHDDWAGAYYGPAAPTAREK